MQPRVRPQKPKLVISANVSSDNSYTPKPPQNTTASTTVGPRHCSSNSKLPAGVKVNFRPLRGHPGVGFSSVMGGQGAGPGGNKLGTGKGKIKTRACCRHTHSTIPDEGTRHWGHGQKVATSERCHTPVKAHSRPLVMVLGSSDI